jgi:hypothetical protein
LKRIDAIPRVETGFTGRPKNPLDRALQESVFGEDN